MENQTRTQVAGSGTVELPELLTLQQASKILKVHPNTLRNWEKAGVIPVVRVGPRRDRRFPKHGIHQFLPPAPSVSADPAASAQAQPAQEIETVSAKGSADQSEEVLSTPNVTEQELEAVQDKTPADPSAAETPHVIVNVPPKTSMRTQVTIVVFLLALIVAAILFGPDLLSTQQASESATFAIRRYPPRQLFNEGFEVYEVGTTPGPVWNTTGLWQIEEEAGQRFLRGKNEQTNPLDLKGHVYTGASNWKDYKLTFSARVVEGKRAIVALVNYLDKGNYYAVRFNEDEVSVALAVGGKEQIIGSAPIVRTDFQSWQTFAINLFGPDRIDVFLNGDRVLGVDDPSLTSGKIGFLVDGQTADFDHVQVLESTEGVVWTD